MPGVTKNLSKKILTRFGGGVSFGDVLYGPAGQCGPRLQREYLLVILSEGELDLGIGDIRTKVPVGHVALCLPGQQIVFQFARKGSARHQWCSVKEGVMGAEFIRDIGGRGGVVSLPDILHMAVRAGLETPLEDSPGNLRLLRSLAHTAFASFLAAREKGKAEFVPEPLRSARRFIQEHYGGELTLERLAHHAGITPNHLVRLFRDRVGITPMEYVWQVRLAQSFIWLRETGLSVAEIAYRAGFQNPFHFSRRFKKHYGCSPRECRSRLMAGRWKGSASDKIP